MFLPLVKIHSVVLSLMNILIVTCNENLQLLRLFYFNFNCPISIVSKNELLRVILWPVHVIPSYAVFH